MFKTSLKTILAGSILVASSLSFAADIDMNADANDLAIKGYDPVSSVSYTHLTLPTIYSV